MKKLLLKNILATILLSSALTATAGDKPLTGKEIAEDRKLGNCLACHMIPGANLPGNIAPPLVAMKARFPNIEDLRAQIADPRINNKNSMMPLFGAFEALTPEQVDKVTEYIHSL